MKYTDWDADAVARAILGEASNQGYIGKVAVASVIANRAATNFGQYGSTPFEQVMAPSQFTSLDPHRGKNAYNLTTAPKQSPQYQQALAIAEGVLSGLIPDPTGGATSYWAKGSENSSEASGGTKDRVRRALATGKILQIGEHLFDRSNPKYIANRPPANFQTLLAGSQSADQIDRLRDIQQARLSSSPEIEARAAAQPGNLADNKGRLIDQAEATSEQAPDEGSPQAAPTDPRLSTAWTIAATGMGKMSMTDALAFLRGQIIQEQLQSPGLSEDEAMQRIGRQYGLMDLPLSEARTRQYEKKAVELPNDPEDWTDPRKISGAIGTTNPPPSFVFPSYVNGRSFHSDAQDLSDRIDAWGLPPRPPASLNFEEPATNASPQPLQDAGSQEQPPNTNGTPGKTGAPQAEEAPRFTPPVLPDSLGTQRPFGIFQNLPTSRDTGNGEQGSAPTTAFPTPDQ